MNDSVDQGRRHKQPVGSPPSQSALAYMSAESDSYHDAGPLSTSPPRNAPMSAPPGNSIHIPDRPNFPTRASTAPSPHDHHDPKKQRSFDAPHSRSEDLNHTDATNVNDQQASDLGASRSQGPFGASRPTTPASSSIHYQPSSSETLDSSRRRLRSIASDDTSIDSDSSATGASGQAPASTTHTTASMSTTYVDFHAAAFVSPHGFYLALPMPDRPSLF